MKVLNQRNYRFSQKVLREVMGRLEDASPVFTLHVSDGPSERIIYFVGSGVRVLSIGERSGPDVQSFLLDQGILGVEKLHEILEASRVTKQGVKDILLQKGVLDGNEYNDIVARLIRDEVLDLTFWDDAFFRLHTDSPPREIYDQQRNALAGKMDCGELAEAVKEWSHKWSVLRSTLHSDRALITLSAKGRQSFDLKDALLRTIASCDEGISLRALWRTSGVNLPVACERLVEMAANGWIEIEPPPRRDTAQSTRRTIEQLETIVGRVVGKDLVRQKLVTLYRKVRQDAKAVEQLKHLAASAEEQSEWAMAVAHLREALQIRPDDLESFDRAVEILRGQGDAKEALRLATGLSELLVNRGNAEAAARVAKVLGKLSGSRYDETSILAAALANSGQLKSAAERYEQLARMYGQSGDLQKASEMSRKAVELDPQNHEMRERLARFDPALRAETGDNGRTADAGSRRVASPVLLWLLLLVCVVAGLHLSGVVPLPLKKALAGLTATKDGGAPKNSAVQVTLPSASGSPSAPPAGSEGAAPPGEQREAEIFVGSGATAAIDVVEMAVAPERDPVAPRSPDRKGSEATTTYGRGGPESAVRSARRSPAAGAAHFTAGIPLAYCAHPVPHRLVRRPLDENRKVTAGTSCNLEVLDRRSGRRLFRLPGAPGAGWAVGFRGQLFCRWRPGEAAVFFDRHGRNPRRASWRLPAETVAVAAGDDFIAVRHDHVTSLFDRTGRSLHSGPLPPWSAGVITGESLILQKLIEHPGESRSLWFVDCVTWQVVWACVDEAGVLNVR